MIRLLLFMAVTYCFNQVVHFESLTDMTMDLDPSSRYFLDLFYIALPLTALLYARITKWVFSFNKKEKTHVKKMVTSSVPKESSAIVK